MPELQLRAYLPALVLIAGSALLVQGTREQATLPPAAPLAGILSNVNGYRVQDQKIGDDERRVAGMSDYVARLYWQDTTIAFTTYVGYYEQQTQGRSIHSPKNCLPGAGWEVLRAGTATVPSSSGPHVVNRYLLKNGHLQAVVYYWYQGRGRVVANEYAVKLNLLRDAALLGHTEEALVRIVIPVPQTDDRATQTFEQEDRLALQIVPRLIDEVGRVMPRSSATRGTAVAAF